MLIEQKKVDCRVAAPNLSKKNSQHRRGKPILRHKKKLLIEK
jgi:hypothetical protein